jgi:copper homeostasis protein
MPNRFDFKVESCVVSLEQALEAEARGADRLEICSRLETEGMTPDAELVSLIIDRIQIPVRIMIRETETGFAASEDVLQNMIAAIQIFRSMPVDGFVFGILKNQMVDRNTMNTLLDHAASFPVTFHKAIDSSSQIMEDISWLNQFPQIDTLLTSGGMPKAKEGIAQIREMKKYFLRNIMAAGKITPDVLQELHEALQLEWYHGRGV